MKIDSSNAKAMKALISAITGILSIEFECEKVKDILDVL